MVQLRQWGLELFEKITTMPKDKKNEGVLFINYILFSSKGHFFLLFFLLKTGVINPNIRIYHFMQLAIFI